MATASPHRPTVTFLLLLLGLAVVPMHAASEQEDARLIAEMTKKRDEIKKQLQGATTQIEQDRLLKALNAAADETWPKLTPKGRTLVKFNLEVIEPWEGAELDYAKMAGELNNASQGGFAMLKTRGDIQSRLEMMDRLVNASRQLFAQTNNLEQMVVQLVDGSELSQAEKQSLMKGFHEKYDQRIYPTRDLRNLSVLLNVQMQQMFSYLDKHWGQWQLSDVKPIVWTDAALEAQFQAIVDELGALLKRANEAQQALKPNP